MSENDPYQQIRSRVRDTCITSCPYYPGLKGAAELEQEKVNAARAAGQAVIGTSVKIVCPHDPTAICSGFVHAPIIKENPGDAELSPNSQGMD